MCCPPGEEQSCQGFPIPPSCYKYPLTQLGVFNPRAVASDNSSGHGSAAAEPPKPRARASNWAETPRWAGRSLKQNCQSTELVPLATVMLEIGLRVGAKKPTQKKGVLSCWLSHWGRVLAQGSPCPVPQGLGRIRSFWGPPGSCDTGKGCQGAGGICGGP